MNENNMTKIRMPRDWKKFRDYRSTVDEGEYPASVQRVEQPDQDHVRVAFELLGPGPFNGRRLVQIYNLDTDGGKGALVEFLQAIKVEPENDDRDPAACQDKVLCIDVGHHEYQGRTYAHVAHCMHIDYYDLPF